MATKPYSSNMQQIHTNTTIMGHAAEIDLAVDGAGPTRAASRARDCTPLRYGRITDSLSLAHSVAMVYMFR